MFEVVETICAPVVTVGVYCMFASSMLVLGWKFSSTLVPWVRCHFLVLAKRNPNQSFFSPLVVQQILVVLALMQATNLNMQLQFKDVCKDTSR